MGNQRLLLGFFDFKMIQSKVLLIEFFDVYEHLHRYGLFCMDTKCILEFIDEIWKGDSVGDLEMNIYF